MRPVLTADEYSRVDKAYQGDLDVAMDRAGHAVAMAAARAGARYGAKVTVLAGPGNNGGDGYVAARYLAARGAAVTVQSLGLPKAAEAVRAAGLAQSAGVRIEPIGEPADEDVIVDALFGGGVRGGLPLPVFPWLSASAPVVAVDYPTGLDPNTGQVEERAFHAVETVTFGTVKTGHVLGAGPDHCGRLTVADIGIVGGEPAMYIATSDDVVLPPRERKAHKWSAGAVMIVGGSKGLAGAAVLAARGALAFGAGSVAIAAADQDAITSNTVEFPNFPLDEAAAHIDRFGVVIFGSGLSGDDLERALPVLEKATDLVIDAGGLVPEVVGRIPESGVEAVLTPHSGEFGRISEGNGGSYAVRALAAKLGAVVLLKGNPTRISDGGPPVLVQTGGPELATIGTGDVLAGMIGALRARGVDPLRAAITAAYLHGVAGSRLRSSGSFSASDLADEVRRHAW